MRILLISPAHAPNIWSLTATAELLGRKATLPPLALLTAAAHLSHQHELKLVDQNVRQASPEEWDWAEAVLVYATPAQRHDCDALVHKASQAGKRVTVLGSYAPSDAACGAGDFVYPDASRTTLSPTPRFDLLEPNAYCEMAVQFSTAPTPRDPRDGSDFSRETAGLKPLTQILAELQRLYDLGWRGPVFLADANLAADRGAARALLGDLAHWMDSHNHPFSFTAPVSPDIADDAPLLAAMTRACVDAVLLDLPIPRPAPDPLESAVQTLTRAGLRVAANFTLGRDHEPRGAAQRIVDFVEQTSIPTAAISTAGPPADQLARDYVSALWRLYDPQMFIDRAFRHHSALAQSNAPRRPSPAPIPRHVLKTLFWRQGVRRDTRLAFWRRIWQLYKVNPAAVPSFLSTCAQAEHFLPFRQQVRADLQPLLARSAHAASPKVEVTLTGATLKLPSADRNQAIPQS